MVLYHYIASAPILVELVSVKFVAGDTLEVGLGLGDTLAVDLGLVVPPPPPPRERMIALLRRRSPSRSNEPRMKRRSNSVQVLNPTGIRRSTMTICSGMKSFPLPIIA